MRIGRTHCLISLASLFSLVCSAQMPKYSASLAGSNKSVCTVDYLANGAHQRCAIVVAISQANNAMKRKLTLPIEIATVNSLRASPGGHLVVLGEGPTKFQRFLVYDIATRDLLINELCYFPAVSPNGSWIAYQRFIPPHGMEPLAVDLKVYAVDSAPAGEAKPPIYSLFRGPKGSWIFSNPNWSPNGDLVLWGIVGTAAGQESLVLLRRTPQRRQPFKAEIARVDTKKLCQGNSWRDKPDQCGNSIQEVQFPSPKSADLRITFKRVGTHGEDQKSVTFQLEEFREASNMDKKG